MGAEEFLPERRSLTALRSAAASCRGCGLYAEATQTVFGSGKRTAQLVFVGEQPGDQEDRAGEPFVGPAGRVLDEALEELGISRTAVYLTNVVKHFKFVPPERGKRRLHKRPDRGEIEACRPWLGAELRAVRPEVLVLLGATAAKSLLGQDFRVTAQRGRLLEQRPPEVSEVDAAVLATVHPSSIIRAPDREARRREYRTFVADLAVATHELA